MRLIDADKLINNLNNAIKRKGLSTEDKKKGMWCAWFLDIIAQVSTVEAIPIEWLEREFSRRGIVTSHFRVMVGNEQLPDEVYVDARIVARDIIDVWREEQKDETDRSRAFD